MLSDSTVLLGSSSETAILKSTGLDADTPLLTMESGGPNPIQNLRIEGVGTALYVDGQGGANAALDWLAFNLVDCGKVGTIKDITSADCATRAGLLPVDCAKAAASGSDSGITNRRRVRQQTRYHARSLVPDAA